MVRTTPSELGVRSILVSLHLQNWANPWFSKGFPYKNIRKTKLFIRESLTKTRICSVLRVPWHKNRANSELRRSYANHRSIIISQKYTRRWFSNLPVPSRTVMSSIHALRPFFPEIFRKSCWLSIILWITLYLTCMTYVLSTWSVRWGASGCRVQSSGRPQLYVQ